MKVLRKSRGTQLTYLFAWKAAVMNQHVNPLSDHVNVVWIEAISAEISTTSRRETHSNWI
jgi:hypothetical protein